MSIETAEVMLYQWGAWVRGNDNLGFSSLSVIGRCIDEGPGASHSTVQGEPHMSVSVEVTEQAILEMPKVLQRVCKHRYIGLEPDMLAAKKLKLTLDIYQTRINQAVHALTNFITVN